MRPGPPGLFWAAVALTGGVLAATQPTAPATADAPATAEAPAGRPAADRPAMPVVTAAGDPARAPAVPVRVRIPSIGVDSALLPLGVDDAGTLVPPGDFGRAGWFTGGVRPGAVGPAVIAGHVDSYAGPAVFARLAEVGIDDVVVVERADGTSARFAVTGVEQYAKDDFPTDVVYGPTTDAQLRLITCGGRFDRQARSYRDNVVVSATAV